MEVTYQYNDQCLYLCVCMCVCLIRLMTSYQIIYFPVFVCVSEWVLYLWMCVYVRHNSQLDKHLLKRHSSNK